MRYAVPQLVGAKMRFHRLKRRDFITLLGCAAAWPLAARAQQTERIRRIGALMGFGEDDAEGTLWLSSFKVALQELGWVDGRNVLMDVRWSASNTERERMFAKELVSLRPDVILAHGTPVTAALRRETQMIPIVFGAVADPVGEGFVESLSRPGGNITGFLFSEAGMGGKWLELLKEIAPNVKRAAMIFNPDTAPGRGSHYLPSFEAAARSLGVEPITEPVHNEAEIETVVTRLGHKPESGLVAIGDSLSGVPPKANYSGSSREQSTSGLFSCCICQRRRIAFLRTRQRRHISPCCLLRRSHTPWRKPIGASGAGTDQV